MAISWYPGHMAKTKRLLEGQLSRVDMVIELCDARLPYSSRNPELLKMCKNKPRVLLLNKADLASREATSAWVRYFKGQGETALPLEAQKKGGVKQTLPLIYKAAEEILDRAEKRGFKRTLRAMVIGVPNVGKSTFINTLSGQARLKAEDRPGVTRGTQWVRVGTHLEIMDTPGMLWPRLDDQEAARRLCYIAAVRDAAVDVYDLCLHLLDELMQLCPEQMTARFKIGDASLRGQALLEEICRGRGFLLPGAECDIDRAVAAVLNDFRDGRIARLTLEMPPNEGEQNGNQP